jgi:hypothetical protein
MRHAPRGGRGGLTRCSAAPPAGPNTRAELEAPRRVRRNSLDPALYLLSDESAEDERPVEPLGVGLEARPADEFAELCVGHSVGGDVEWTHLYGSHRSFPVFRKSGAGSTYPYGNGLPRESTTGMKPAGCWGG